MAHIGKIWPVYNPARRCIPEGRGNLYPPTEFQWQVDNWSGITGIGSETGGRGMVADPYDPAFFGWSYSAILTGAIFRPWKLRLVFTARPDADPDTFATAWGYDIYFQCLDLSGNQVQCAVRQLDQEAYFWEPTFYYDTPLPGTPFYSGIPGSTIYPTSFISFRGRRWTDLPPKPPMSTPF